jgi:N-methylhydantoinase A
MHVIGIDVGGTFTDLVIYDEADGSVRTDKVPSTTPDPTDGLMAGLEKNHVDLAPVRRIVHGPTIATNATLERKGAKTGVIINRGHRDVLEFGMIGRYKSGGLFHPNWTREAPFVERRLRCEIGARLAHDGRALGALREEEIVSAAELFRREGVEAVAVCLLHSYLDGRDEHRVAEIMRRHLPAEVAISLSCETVPEHREYERWSTTVLNAYVAPRLRSYLKRLGGALRAGGYRGEIFYMTSSGGVVTEASAADYPIRFILSGPAGGVSNGMFFGESAGLRNVITIDIGGTSADVCLIKDMKPVSVSERVFQGIPIKTPQLDIVTIGAGGGSIAHVDREGRLRVGPQSAGGFPGPICYRRGGSEVTVTDANLILGRLGTGTIAAGSMQLDRGAALQGLKQLASRVGVPDVYRLAEGIIQIAVNNMCGGVRTLSVERGHDPREFTLVALGGAGAMHIIPIARELAMSSALVPANAGTGSAFGLLCTDLQHDYVRTYVTPIRSADPKRIRRLLEEMADQGRRTLAREGIEPAQMAISCLANMRYAGQSWQLNVPTQIDSAPEETEAAFHGAYHQAYGYSRKDMTVELVYLRVLASARIDKPRPARAAAITAAAEPFERMPVYFDGAFVDTPLYRQDELPAGASLSGPAVIEERGATVVLFPGWGAAMDVGGNLLLRTAKKLAS